MLQNKVGPVGKLANLENIVANPVDLLNLSLFCRQIYLKDNHNMRI